MVVAVAAVRISKTADRLTESVLYDPFRLQDLVACLPKGQARQIGVCKRVGAKRDTQPGHLPNFTPAQHEARFYRRQSLRSRSVAVLTHRQKDRG
jgi:hypothetical protein